MTARPARTMTVAGVMSGTSADGVDVAICRISPGADTPRLKVLAHRHFRYEKRLRSAVLAAASGTPQSAAEFARLSWRLGEVYADCIEATASELGSKLHLIACHGQTIHHQASTQRYFGMPLRCTWQTGEPAPIAERLRVPVVSDLRSADLAAGGQGAPLVPMLDFCLFHHSAKNRLLLNLGGIANITALPAGCSIEDVLAFDTGPANMVLDAVMQRLTGKSFDRHGSMAGRGQALASVVEKLMQASYFSAAPPKSCGREEFGEAFVSRLLKLCGQASPEDSVATATALTIANVLDAYHRFCSPHFGQRAPQARATEVLVAGGGAKNRAMMRLLSEEFGRLGIRVATTEAAGVAVEAKEAAAFALMGWLTWHGLPGNVPSATGAKRAVVLGKVSLP